MAKKKAPKRRRTSAVGKCPKGKRGKACRRQKRRGVRGLGDLLSQRATALAVKAHNAGRKVSAAKLDAAAANSLCREGHKEYCGGTASRRTARSGRVASARASRASLINAERASMGLKPRAAMVASSASQAAITPAKVDAAEVRATRKGCVAPKGRVCVDKAVAVIKGKRGGLREGCVKFKGVKNTYVCTNRAVTQQAAGRGRAQGQGVASGWQFASMKRAINPLTGTFKSGCKFHLKAGKAMCKRK